VIWGFLVEDSSLFLKYFMEKLTRKLNTFQSSQKQIEIFISFMRKGPNKEV
jgi:hypothetical protein